MLLKKDAQLSIILLHVVLKQKKRVTAPLYHRLPLQELGSSILTGTYGYVMIVYIKFAEARREIMALQNAE